MRFFINTNHHSIFWRLQIQSNDIRSLDGKLGIGAEAPTLPPLEMNAVLFCWGLIIYFLLTHRREKVNKNELFW